MDNSPVQKPKKALEVLRTVLVPEGTLPDTIIELIICISGENLSIRDMSAFLEFIDHICGRLTPGGFRAYARREHGHLKISKMRKGSWELVLDTVFSYLKQSEIIFVIWLALKYLPHVIQAGATAYNEYEQGRLARENRKRIRQEIEEDEKLRSLPANRRRELSSLLDILYSREADKLPRAIRFAKKSLMHVQIRVRRKKTNKDKKATREGDVGSETT